MLSRSGLSDDATFAHSTGEQHLSRCVVDLVRAGMQKIFTLQIDLRSPGMRGQPFRVKQRGWPATVIAQQLIQLLPEIRVHSRSHELVSQFVKRRD